MTGDRNVGNDDGAIRGVLDAIAQAVRDRDVEAFLEHCTPDVVVFDLLPPLEQEGPQAIRRSWATALGSFQGKAEYEVQDLQLAVSGDVAFARGLTRFGGTQKGGPRSANWLRTTFGFRKLAGRWKVAHQHVSVPFDMETSKAMLDLKP